MVRALARTTELRLSVPACRGGVQLARRRLGGHQPNAARATPRSPSWPATRIEFDRFPDLGRGNSVQPGARAGRAGHGAVWAATDLGVARVEPDGGPFELVDERRGLPDSRVYSIVSRGGRSPSVPLMEWSGSATRSRWSGWRHDTAVRCTPSFRRVTRCGSALPPDCCWHCLDRPNLVRPDGHGLAQLRPRGGSGTLGDTLVALTRDGFLWRDPRSRRWTLGPNLSACSAGFGASSPMARVLGRG